MLLLFVYLFVVVGGGGCFLRVFFNARHHYLVHIFLPMLFCSTTQ